MSFWASLKNIFKNYFIAGTLVLLPVAATIWVLKTVIVWADGFIISMFPRNLQTELIGFEIPGFGLLLTLSLILLLGILTRVYLGKKLLDFGDMIISKIPLGRGIYHGLKEMTNVFFSPHKEKKFKRVVLVEYPRRDAWTIAFVTGDCDETLSPPASSEKFIRIFVPTAPNPTSGFLLIVPEKDTHPVHMSVEDTLKLILSGGIVKPKHAQGTFS